MLSWIEHEIFNNLGPGPKVIKLFMLKSVDHELIATY